MILPTFRRTPHRRTIRALYGAIVAQARSAAFYADWGVPDTVEGRFDVIVLHLVLLLRRLGGEDNSTGRGLGQALFDVFCRDLDDNLREMGVGDLAVPKKMRQFAEAFYGRQAAYLAALAAPDQRDIENAVARNIFQAVGVDDRAVQLARYVRATCGRLNAQEDGMLQRGEINFPNPKAFAHERT